MTKHRDQLVIDLDKFAADLLRQAKEPNPTVPVSIDQKGIIFEKVTRWVMVKYKIEPEEQDGSGLIDLKRRTKGEDVEPDRTTRAERVAAAQRERPGRGIQEFKRTLPVSDGDASGSLSTRLHAVREVSSTTRSIRGRDIGLSGDDGTDDGEDRSSGNV